MDPLLDWFQMFLIQVSIICVKSHTYVGQGDSWEGACNTGTKQSPIDVVTAHTIRTNFIPFIFMNYDQELNLEMKNTKHTIKFEIAPPRDRFIHPYVRGGGLKHNYQFFQGHFHWGSKINQGSEHCIDGKFSPMEIHLVHFNTNLGKTPAEAIAANQYNSLAVLGGKFVIGRKNLGLKPLFEALSNVQNSGKKTKIKEKMKLSDLAPKNIESFFRYNGSLTTPGCNEIVVWTLFKEPIEISQDQLDEIRKTKNSQMKENSNNYRKVQPLNGRKVLDSRATNIIKIDMIILLISSFVRSVIV